MQPVIFLKTKIAKKGLIIDSGNNSTEIDEISKNILKKKGFSISHSKIEKLLLRNDLVKPNIKKQRCRKWVRY